VTEASATPVVATAGGRKAAMPFIMITVLIDMMSIGLIIPVLAPLVGTFTAGSRADQAFWFAAVSFAFGFANFFGAPILGALSDKHGRRPVLLMGFFGLALSFFVTAMATALWMLIAVRLLSGAMQANAAVANAYVADITPAELRAKRFGMLGAMFGLGFMLGPVTGGLLGEIDLHLPFYVSGALAVTNWLYGYFVLPESLPKERRRAIDWKRANPISSLKKLSQLKGVGGLVVVIALSALAQFILHTTWVLYTHFKFGWGPKENGLSLLAVGVASVIVQGGLMGQLLKIMSARRLAVLGLMSSCLGYALWGAATQGWMMYAIIFANLLGFSATAALQSLFSNAADASAQGATLGAMASLNSLMAVAAPVVGGGLLTLVSELPKGHWLIGLPYYFCSALQLCAMLLALRHFKRERQRNATAAAAASAS